MPFTADHGVTRREEILQTKLLQHPASYYSSMHKFSENDPFFHKCLERQTAWLGASFYKSVGLEASEFKDWCGPVLLSIQSPTRMQTPQWLFKNHKLSTGFADLMEVIIYPPLAAIVVI